MTSSPNAPSQGTAISGFTCLFVNEITPGHEQEYLDKVKEHVLPMYRKHGVDLLGCWRGGIGVKSNAVVFLISYHTMDQYNSLYSDPEYIAMDADMGFKQLRSNLAWLLRPVDFSPIQ